MCATFSGEPSLSRVELFTQNAYFAFLVVQVFLVTTFSSGATAVAKKIVDNPTSTPELLATNLPKASTFYMAYFVLQGFAIAVGTMTKVIGWVIFVLVYKLFANTPRAMYTKWVTLTAISWGNTMPTYSLITVICITYAGIAPLVSGFAFIGIALFYLAFRYNVLFVTDAGVDTHGLIYPRALKQLLVGVYLAELCLIGLFGASKAFGPFVMMIVFLVFTLLFNITLFRLLDPLLYNLPQSQQVAAEEEEQEEQSLKDSSPNLHVEAFAAPGGRPGDGIAAPEQAKNNAYKRNTASPTTPEQDEPTKSVRREGAKNPNFLVKWLKPWLYADYKTLRQLVPQDPPSFPRQSSDSDAPYADDVARDAYFPPSVGDKTPLLWIPEDPAGISKEEVRDTAKVIPITDEGCTIDEKGKLYWDTERAKPPIWEEKVQF